LRGTGGIYGIIDQQLYRPKGGTADSGIAIFSRIAASPADRSVIDFYLDGGVVFSGLDSSRPNDKLSAGFIYAKYANRLAALDRDRILFSGTSQPIRDYEAILEVNYMYLMRPGWALQPLAQYFIHPGGNIPNPDNPSQPIKSGAIFGLRSTLVY
jgi:porin